MLFYKVGPGSSYRWSCTPYKWPSKWVTGVITLPTVVITPLITGRGPPCISISQTVSQFPCHYNCYPLALRPYQLYHVSCLLNYKCFTGKRKGLGHTRIKKKNICAMVIPPWIGNPYNGYINPYYWVEFPIPYYMEMSWELIDPGAYKYIKQHLWWFFETIFKAGHQLPTGQTQFLSWELITSYSLKCKMCCCFKELNLNTVSPVSKAKYLSTVKFNTHVTHLQW